MEQIVWLWQLRMPWNTYKNFYVGSSLKYIRASIDNYSADAMAIDAGFIFKISFTAISACGRYL